METFRYYYSDECFIETQKGLVYEGDLYPTSLVSLTRKNGPRLTICGYYNSDENTISFGVSRCSEKDTFNKKKGRELAKYRAISNPYIVRDIDGNKYDLFISQCLDIEQRLLFNCHIKF